MRDQLIQLYADAAYIEGYVSTAYPDDEFLHGKLQQLSQKMKDIVVEATDE